VPDESKLKPIPGLLQKKFAKVEDLSTRLRQQQRNIWSLPDSAKLIQADEELRKFCSASDLVAITASEDQNLCNAAFSLLRGPFNAALTADDVNNLLKHLQKRNASVAWKASCAAGVLGVNREFGVLALVRILRESDASCARVHAAGGLTEEDSTADVKQRRVAAEVLLRSLGNEDDTSRVAHNHLPSLEPWMVEWLIERLSDAGASATFVKNATSRLSSCDPKGFEKPLRASFLRALKHADPMTRICAVNGLRNLGLTETDIPLYRRIHKDENPHVRRMLYAGLRDLQASWSAELLIDGLGDTLPENIGICAGGLVALEHKPAVPKLVEALRRAPAAANQPFGEGYRRAGEAATRLAGLEGYDFRMETRSVGSRFAHATAIVDRGDVYRSECARLLEWWNATGSKLIWDRPPALPQDLVTTGTSLETAGMRTVEVIRAVATTEARITKRSVSHESTVMDDIEGGGEVSFAYCRQGFSVLDVLAGKGKRGSREIDYGFVEKAEGFPLPRPRSPIPKGARVVLALGVGGSLLKVIPDTDKNRQTIGEIANRVKNRPPAAKALIAATDSFSLKIEYHGPKPELYYSIVCTTSRRPPRNLPSNWLVMQNVSDLWAYQALDHLVRTGVLDPKATRAEQSRSSAKEPFYSLTVSAEGTEDYTRNLGWGKQAYDRLEALAKAIQYDGGTMAKLLARLKESR
jgi:hypothetical protein